MIAPYGLFRSAEAAVMEATDGVGTLRGEDVRALGYFVALGLCCGLMSGQEPRETIHFVHGVWFDGTTFKANDFYTQDGMLTHRPTERRAFRTVDLHGGYVVPPFGDAHEHNFDGTYGLAPVMAEYLADGVFYAQGMTDTTEGAREVMNAKLVNTPQSVDVTYAHGGLTGVNGHPKEVYEALLLGFYAGLNAEQRTQVKAAHAREGLAYWEIDTEADLAAKWPRILASKPDLIKIYLSDSENYATNKDELGKGLNPALVGAIVARAHAAGLKVAAHVDTAADYHAALVGGVDEMGHMPGYYLSAKDDAAKFRISDADVALTAKRGVKVQATAGIGVDAETPAEDLKARKASQIDNLGRLKAAGVEVLVGSDHYGKDPVHEADYLQGLGVWSNLEMLRMWAVATPQDVFPKRKIGELKAGYEASFLVLASDPLKDWRSVHAIVARWKQGERIGAGTTRE